MGVKSVYNHADYRLMSQRAVQHLCRFRERNLFLRGLVPLIGYQTDSVYYNRDKRFAGESKYPFRKMLNFAIDGITSFSVKPVRMIFWIGCIFILVALCVTGWTLHSYTQHNAVPGWSSLMISVWLVGGVILAHGFAQAGGVMGAVKAYLKEEADKINAVQVANLDKKAIGSLRAYAKTGKAPGQFIEVMACEGGCITGP